MTYTVPRQNGLFPRKQHVHFNPLLADQYAYMNNLVHRHWEYMVYSWKPSNSLLLLTPCSNNKPYIKSPMNTKIRRILQRLELWDKGSDQPSGIDWVFISDLLGPVPYNYTWVEPACCYEAPPNILDDKPCLENKVIEVIKQWWNRVHGYYKNVLYYLPVKYHRLTSTIKKHHGNPQIHIITYHIFYGQRYIEKVLLRITRRNLSKN